MAKVRRALTKRVLKWFDEEARKDAALWSATVADFDKFLKAAILNGDDAKAAPPLRTMTAQEDVARLLRFRTIAQEGVVSLGDFVAGLEEGGDIHFAVAPSVESARASPYVEPFVKLNRNVLVVTEFDELALLSLDRFDGHRFVSVESPDVNVAAPREGVSLGEGDKDFVISFVKAALGAQVASVGWTARVADAPALVVAAGHSTLRKLNKLSVGVF
jgi:HSP90 family molecular chaperone